MFAPAHASKSKTAARFLPQSAKPAPFFQAKLTVNQPGDAHEQEADRVADQVMQMPAFAPSTGKSDGHAPIAQRMPFTPVSSVMRACAECEKEKMQRKESGGGNASGKAAPSIVSDVLSSGGGQPMDGGTRQFMESRFGQDFSQVRVHTGSRAAESASAIQARAYTSGRDVVFGAGEYQPGSEGGRRLLAHELVHVGQQGGEQRQVQKTEKTADIPYKGSTCTAKREWVMLDRPMPVTAKFDADSTNVTLNINWCRGKSKGDITIGANIPGQAKGLAADILDILRRGGGKSDIETTFRGADLTPFVEAIITQNGSFKLSLNGEVTVGLDGWEKAKAGVQIKTGPITVDVTAEADKATGGKQVVVGATIPLGGSKAEEVKCDTIKVPFGKPLTCECQGPASKQTVMIKMPYFSQTKFLYFDYSTANIDQARSAAPIAEINELLDLGYRVTAVTGFTSPEGTKTNSPGFEGNIELAGKRADRALELIKGSCASMLRMRRCAGDAVSKEIKPIGGGELHSANDPRGKELEGKKLAESAVPEIEADKDEAVHLGTLTEKERKGLDKARTVEEKAKIYYPLLRRAAITFDKVGMHDTPIEIDMLPAKTPCPPEVTKEAETKLPR